MEKTSQEQLQAIKHVLKQTSDYAHQSVEQIRQGMNEAAARFPMLPDIVVEDAVIGQLHGEWVRGQKDVADQKVILYFHGGGFIAGSCEFYRDLAARISMASGVSVLTVDYRLAPEYPYPAANEDCLSAYHWLLDQGYSARDIVLGGDSVGGSLALMTLLSLRDAGDELPRGAFLMSPHTDLVHLDGDSYVSRAALDPTGSLLTSGRIVNDYLGNWSGAVPALLSPLNMNLHGLPSLFIQVGDHEVLLSDSTRFADRARAAGVEVTLEIWEEMWSVFHTLAYMLPEAQQAIRNIGLYVQRQFSNN
ncbi:alpha/beta hydrolase [Paenibacillus albiflavus]|uniref:Alpha/beta hydrolase n=1 Tax=Paenibacillus albiflavus TaxID=2545760 RepID=A0A4R4ELS1_9BACL|nr:alpha/beta hydrolase [Paenibacillus albiflavus]TCZ79411.1 alpha/beta hydrolase [Paenibacillus albiflavus]